jgi:hypothetical protein
MDTLLSAMSALSAGGQSAVIAWKPGTNQDLIRNEVEHMTLNVTCLEQTRRRKFRWVWVGLTGFPGQFTLTQFQEQV